jgi:hypothetical protein
MATSIQASFGNEPLATTVTTTILQTVLTSVSSTKTEALTLIHLMRSDSVAKVIQNLTYVMKAAPRGYACSGSYFSFAAQAGQMIVGGFVSTAPISFFLLNEKDYPAWRYSADVCILPSGDPKVTTYVSTGPVTSFKFNWTAPATGNYYFHLLANHKPQADATVTLFASVLFVTPVQVTQYLTNVVTSTSGEQTPSLASQSSTQSGMILSSSEHVLELSAVAFLLAVVVVAIILWMRRLHKPHT